MYYIGKCIVLDRSESFDEWIMHNLCLESIFLIHIVLRVA